MTRASTAETPVDDLLQFVLRSQTIGNQSLRELIWRGGVQEIELVHASQSLLDRPRIQQITDDNLHSIREGYIHFANQSADLHNAFREFLKHLTTDFAGAACK
jgi:hypothetical protein